MRVYVCVFVRVYVYVHVLCVCDCVYECVCMCAQTLPFGWLIQPMGEEGQEKKGSERVGILYDVVKY